VRPEQSRTEDPRQQRRPAEELQRARRDELRDALCAAVGGCIGLRQRLYLHEVEIVQYPDPHHSEEEVEPPEKIEWKNR